METWKEVVGGEGVYEVSDLGGVRNALTGTRLSPYWRGRYLCFTVHLSGRRKAVLLHRSVLEAFRGPSPAGTVGAHLDGDAAHCALSNLAWATPADNEAHKLAHGTHARGERSTQARFTNAEAELVREIYAKGISARKIARLTRVAPSTIDRIVLGRRYQ